jgi:competence protein ComEA
VPVRPRLPVEPTHLAVLALVVAVGLLGAAWWVVRAGGGGTPVPPAAPLPSVAGLVTPGATDVVAASPSASTSVVVDVTGKVRHPGIVVLDAGSRVVDALKAAGGAVRGADLSSLNQARVLVDGEQIVVGTEPAAGIAASASAASVPAAPLINLNTAGEAELESLPGVGPVTAQAILDWRSANGRFTSVEELLEVDGIGDATLAELAPCVTL